MGNMPGAGKTSTNLICALFVLALIGVSPSACAAKWNFQPAIALQSTAVKLRLPQTQMEVHDPRFGASSGANGILGAIVVGIVQSAMSQNLQTNQEKARAQYDQAAFDAALQPVYCEQSAKTIADRFSDPGRIDCKSGAAAAADDKTAAPGALVLTYSYYFNWDLTTLRVRLIASYEQAGDAAHSRTDSRIYCYDVPLAYEAGKFGFNLSNDGKWTQQRGKLWAAVGQDELLAQVSNGLREVTRMFDYDLGTPAEQKMDHKVGWLDERDNKDVARTFTDNGDRAWLRLDNGNMVSMLDTEVDAYRHSAWVYAH